MSRCAGCLVGFSPTDQKIVADTEVFHVRCIDRIQRSVTNQLKVRVINLEARVRLLEPDAAEARRLRISIDAANREAREMRAERDRLATELRELRLAAKTAANAGEYFQDRVHRLELDKEALMGQRDNLQRELALHQQLSDRRRSIDTPIEQTQGQQLANGDPKKDDSEMRFSLIELDLQK